MCRPRPWSLRSSTARRRLGATFSTARVTGLEPAGGATRVATEAGTIEADAVVLAAGSWLSELPTSIDSPLLPTSIDSPHQPPATVRIRPIRGQLLHLKSCAPIASRVLWGPGCYIVPRQDGTVLVGATVEDVGFDERATLGGVRALVDAASALAPGLDSAASRRSASACVRRRPTSCPSSGLRPQCRRSSMRPATTATACCWPR